jgi:hypothetical protein
MTAAGLAFAIKSTTYVLAPAYSSDLQLAPMFLNAVAVAIWMLVRGVDQDTWDRVIADRGHPNAARRRG